MLLFVVLRLRSTVGVSLVTLVEIRLHLTGRDSNLGLRTVRDSGNRFQKKPQGLFEPSVRSDVPDVKDSFRTTI